MSTNPDLSDAEAEALLGAYALDACDPDEVVAIEAVLARRADLADEAHRLIEVAAESTSARRRAGARSACAAPIQAATSIRRWASSARSARRASTASMATTSSGSQASSA